MAKLTGGQAVVKSLIANGIDTIFGLPGVQLDHLFNAFHDEGNSLRVINARHEQGTAYMAFGYHSPPVRLGLTPSCRGLDCSILPLHCLPPTPVILEFSP